MIAFRPWKQCILGKLFLLIREKVEENQLMVSSPPPAPTIKSQSLCLCTEQWCENNLAGARYIETCFLFTDKLFLLIIGALLEKHLYFCWRHRHTVNKRYSFSLLLKAYFAQTTHKSDSENLTRANNRLVSVVVKNVTRRKTLPA